MRSGMYFERILNMKWLFSCRNNDITYSCTNILGGTGTFASSLETGAPNSAKFRGVADLTKGGLLFFFKFLRDKNMNFLEFLREAIKKGLLLRIFYAKKSNFIISTQILLKIRGGSTPPCKIQGGLRPPQPPLLWRPCLEKPLKIWCVLMHFCAF